MSPLVGRKRIGRREGVVSRLGCERSRVQIPDEPQLFCLSLIEYGCIHIVPFGKFNRIGGAPPETFHNVNYDAREEVGGDRKWFDSPTWK